MSTSKDNILQKIRNTNVPVAPLPDLEGNWITYDDPFKQFCLALEAVGAHVVNVADEQQLTIEVEKIIQERNATQVYSQFLNIESANIDLNKMDDPHDCEPIQFALIGGQFGIAENGAIWVDDTETKHRAAWFITQHLGIVISKNEIVNNMHEAYDRIQFDSAGFGVFISGPSKTADIEQSLVIGAHGSRSLSVFVRESF